MQLGVELPIGIRRIVVAPCRRLTVLVFRIEVAHLQTEALLELANNGMASGQKLLIIPWLASISLWVCVLVGTASTCQRRSAPSGSAVVSFYI